MLPMEKSEIATRRYAKYSGQFSDFHLRRSVEREGGRFRFKFVDLFSGIGGIRLALEDIGGECVFSSEWDPHCRETYRFNFGDTPHGDIQRVSDDDIPASSLLAAGFPCQPFSSIGKRRGFAHETQGNLFFRILDILEHFKVDRRRPVDAVLLENVEGLTTLRHDGVRVIDSVLELLSELGYNVEYRVLDAADFGVPQHRRRVYITGVYAKKFGHGSVIDWNFPKFSPADIGPHLEVDVKDYSISRHLQKVYMYKADDGRPQRINPQSKGPVKTLVSTYHKIQRLTGTFVEDGPTELRLLTRNECRAIMGFPSDFQIPEWVSRTQMYRQFGNSVTPPVVRAIAEKLARRISGRSKVGSAA